MASMSPLEKDHAQGKLSNDIAKGDFLSFENAHERGLWYAQHLNLRENKPVGRLEVYRLVRRTHRYVPHAMATGPTRPRS